MKYFLDTEFIEGWKKPISWLPTIGNFNKKYHSVQLISVGIVAEDGREYYAVSNEFNHRDASDWVKENVLLPIYQEMIYGDNRNLFNTDDFHKYYGKSNDKIAEEIYNVVSEIPSRGIELEEIQKSSKIIQETGNFNPDVLYELNHRIDMEKRFLESVSNRLQSTFHALDKLAPNFANSVKEERENSRKIMEEMDQGRK